MPPVKSKSESKAKARAAAAVSQLVKVYSSEESDVVVVDSVPSDPSPVTANDTINNIEVPMSDSIPVLVDSASVPSIGGLPLVAMILIAGVAYTEDDLKSMKRSQVLALLEASDEEIDGANASLNETILVADAGIRGADEAIASWTAERTKHTAVLEVARAGLQSKNTLVFQVAKSLGLTQEDREPVKAAEPAEGKKRRASSGPKAPKRTDTDALTLRCFGSLDEVTDGLAVETIKGRLKLQGVDSSAARSLWCMRLCERSESNKAGRAKNAILVGRNDQFGKMTVFSLNDAGRAAHRALFADMYAAAETPDQEP
jgi:hypothetical protein